MSFLNLKDIQLKAFKPGINSEVMIGETLIMAVMEIGPEKEDTGHSHPFDQCGIVLEGALEMFIRDERKVLSANETYFIPGGAHHGWKTSDTPAKILDISVKQK